ncbi:hypothetical protein HHL16_05715 [Pseudoflavitalea sp. G-6-1-2]|uniref:OB-fold protein n=1 Tax=Pseudoflavitalea sp. G-6-1-2 TaxID=2728841 RepID=UPI00146D183A|nr:hypothetical protein [Pseudoflavitalea sp. G-6-1-2]NML20359.1 hypothetical protein [Pseudoflavitalea sp. G-6-1-2]
MIIRKKRLLIICLLALIGCLLVYAYKQYQRTNQSLREIRPNETVDAAILIRELSGDIHQLESWQGKGVLAVRGIVKSIDSSNRNVYILMGDTSQPTSIRFSMDGQWTDYTLIHSGMSVTLKGMLNGYNKDQTGLLGDEIIFNRGVWMQQPDK